jgi:hypothetical protein
MAGVAPVVLSDAVALAVGPCIGFTADISGLSDRRAITHLLVSPAP